MITLYSYWRSSAAWRVRIALHLKGVAHEVRAVNLVKGAQRGEDFGAVNPAHLVPALVLPGGEVLTQSLAIIDWLEAEYPEPRLLPEGALARARVLAAAHTVAMDIHPVNNLRILNALGSRFGADQAAKVAWMQEWMTRGFDVLEGMVQPGPYFFGDRVTLADLCLVPQAYNVRRWGLDMARWPGLQGVEAACLALPAFAETAPERQADAG